MTAPSAWRPLSEAPRTIVPVIVSQPPPNEGIDFAFFHEGEDGGPGQWRLSGQEAPLDESALFVPIADTLELDRAVQSEIARAFGALIQSIVDAYACTHVATHPLLTLHADAKANYLFEADRLPRVAIRDCAAILHTSMGGRIPDEVP